MACFKKQEELSNNIHRRSCLTFLPWCCLAPGLLIDLQQPVVAILRGSNISQVFFWMFLPFSKHGMLKKKMKRKKKQSCCITLKKNCVRRIQHAGSVNLTYSDRSRLFFVFLISFFHH